MMPQTSVVGAVLAGGESRRMGAPKEGVLLWDGRPMMEHVLAALLDAFERVAVVGECVGFDLPEDARLIHVPDLQPGNGPLAGLEALLASGLSPRYLLSACDQPLLTGTLLRRLADGAGDLPCFFRSEDGTELDPFPGLYPASLLPSVREALNSNRLSIRRFLREQRIEWAPIAPGETFRLRSLNTPEDVAEVTRQIADRR